MNAKTLLAIASVTAAFSGFARANEADYVVDFSKFESTRTRAEVQAEAVAAAKANRSGEADLAVGSSKSESTRTRAEVQAEAVAAAKTNRSGEADAVFAGERDSVVSGARRLPAWSLQGVRGSQIHSGEAVL